MAFAFVASSGLRSLAHGQGRVRHGLGVREMKYLLLLLTMPAWGGTFIYSSPYSETLAQGIGYTLDSATRDAAEAIPLGWAQSGSEYVRCAYSIFYDNGCTQPNDFVIVTFSLARIRWVRPFK